MSYSVQIGDKQRTAKKAIATTVDAFAIVATASLADEDHEINDARLSGKKQGAVVIGSDNIFYVATGDAKDDTWVKQSDGSTVTPV